MSSPPNIPLDAEKAAIEVLRTATRSALRDEGQAYAQISRVMRNGETAKPKTHRSDLEDWVYTLALIYTHQTGLLPGFSNCENETRFERFVFALPAPPQLQLTRNRLKAAIRHMNLKNDPGFDRDIDSLNKST
jgi:hypothetical protein